MTDRSLPPNKSREDTDASKEEPSFNPVAQGPAPTPSPNPWDDAPPSPLATIAPSPPSPPLLDDATWTREPETEPIVPIPQHVAQAAVDEFDPLAKAQAAAWADTEGHPPAPPPKETQPPPFVESGAPIDAARGSASLSGLAAFAQKLSISLPRPGAAQSSSRPESPQPRNRPTSMDGAAPVASPMLRTFAAQLKRVGKRRSVAAVPDSDGFGEDEYDSDGKPQSRVQSPARPAVPGKDEEKPFDFQLFLDQMKSKGAEPAAKYLRSFLSNFSKRTFTPQDQAKLVHDFLDFISVKMRETDPWRNLSPQDFDHALEGMEKLVMNRLYDYTFTPHVASLAPPRPITCDDLDRDRALDQRIRLFSWIEPKHLDVPDGEGASGFLAFAQQELLKINYYKAPRDKLICVLNCCKVIFGLIRHLHSDESADSFLPILIFVVIKSNPEHLLSNIEFISRFRNPEKLRSEAGYYLSSLMGAVSFVENLEHSSLSNITQDEFEQNVDDALANLAPSPAPLPVITVPPPDSAPGTPNRVAPLGLPEAQFMLPSPSPSHGGEEAAQPLALPAPPPASFPSGGGGGAGKQTLGEAISEDARRLLKQTGDSLSRPLSALGRLFNDAIDAASGPSTPGQDYPGAASRMSGGGGSSGGGPMSYLPGPFAPFELGKEARQQQQQHQHYAPQYVGSTSLQTPVASGGPAGMLPPIATPYKPRVRRAPSSSPQYAGTPYRDEAPLPALQASLDAGATGVSRTPTPTLDISAMEAEIDAAHARAEDAARDTLAQIFPTMDAEVRDMVLEANDGDLGRSIEALLEMSGG